MARVLDKFKSKTNPYIKAHGVNYEGFPTFKRSLQEGYLQVLLTNTLGGTFYASEDKLMQESLALHAEMAATHPAFMARALVYARNEGFMRLQPIVGLAYLAKADRDLFRRVFNQVILTPGDLTDFIEIVRGDITPGGMGRSIKSAVNGWLNSLTEYHAIKYATGGQGYSLRDVLRVSHPKPISDKQDAIFLWLTDREKWQAKRDLTPQIDAFEQLKRVEEQQAARDLIKQGRLPYEVVTGAVKPDTATWAALMYQMPYMALLRHLNTLQQAGVLSEAQNAQYVAERLSNENAIQKAKVLPFRLFTASQMFQPKEAHEQAIREALVTALESSFVNMPDLGGRICISPDISSSMLGTVSQMGKTRYADIAGIFTGALLKKTISALVLPFDTEVKKVRFSSRDTVMSIAGQIADMSRGGTAISAPISHLLANKTPVDVFIGITDNVEWATDAHGNTGFLPTWNQYKAKVAPQAKAFLITIAPYRQAVAPQEATDIHYIYGWSDSVLKFITMTLTGLEGQVAAVSQREI